MKKIVSLVLVFSFILLGCGSDKKDPVDKKVLSVSTNAGYPPYEMTNEKGELIGFDIDVMNRIAEISGYKLKWNDVAFDSIIESIKTGKTDVGISGISVSDERRKKVDFTNLYYKGENNVVLVLKNGDIKKTEDIKGKKMGVQLGTVQDTAVEGIAEEYKLTLEKLANFTDLVQEVKMKQISGIVLEEAVAKQLAEKNTELEYFEFKAGEKVEGNAIALPKGSKLVDKFNDAIKEMEKSGELEELRKKWFVVE